MTDMAVYTIGPDTTRNTNFGGGSTIFTAKDIKNEKNITHISEMQLLHIYFEYRVLNKQLMFLKITVSFLWFVKCTTTDKKLRKWSGLHGSSATL